SAFSGSSSSASRIPFLNRLTALPHCFANSGMRAGPNITTPMPAIMMISVVPMDSSSLLDDFDGAGHGIVPAAAEQVAAEGERPGLLRRQRHARRPSRRDVRAQLEVGYQEAVLAVERRELQDHGLAALERDPAR